MEVENLSKDQLEDLIKKAQNQIVVVENKKLDDGYLKMFEIAKELGLTILELNEHGENRKLNKSQWLKQILNIATRITTKKCGPVVVNVHPG